MLESPLSTKDDVPCKSLCLGCDSHGKGISQSSGNIFLGKKEGWKRPPVVGKSRPVPGMTVAKPFL